MRKNLLGWVRCEFSCKRDVGQGGGVTTLSASGAEQDVALVLMLHLFIGTFEICGLQLLGVGIGACEHYASAWQWSDPILVRFDAGIGLSTADL